MKHDFNQNCALKKFPHLNKLYDVWFKELLMISDLIYINYEWEIFVRMRSCYVIALLIKYVCKIINADL